MQRPGTNWSQEPRPIAPPLGRPPPPPPPTRPLAPPLTQYPPPPPPPRPPSSNLPPPFPPAPTHPPHNPTPQPPPLPLSSSPPPPPLPPTNYQPPLPPPPDKQDTDTRTNPTPAKPSSPPSTEQSDTAGKSPPSDAKGFGGMRFKAGGTLLGKRPPGGTITMKLGGPKGGSEPKKSKPVVKKPALVSQAFGNESDEEEEMPPEAKLRMRNVGKDTPTSAGPNSFYKGKMGFSDPRAGYKRYSDDD